MRWQMLIPSKWLTTECALLPGLLVIYHSWATGTDARSLLRNTAISLCFGFTLVSYLTWKRLPEWCSPLLGLIFSIILDSVGYP